MHNVCIYLVGDKAIIMFVLPKRLVVGVINNGFDDDCISFNENTTDYFLSPF